MTFVELYKNYSSEIVHRFSLCVVIIPHSEHQEQSKVKNTNHDSVESKDPEGEHVTEDVDYINPLDNIFCHHPKRCA